MFCLLLAGKVNAKPWSQPNMVEVCKVVDCSTIALVSPIIASGDDIMEKIAYCESRNRQFNSKGKVLRGIVNPKDVGKFQINEYWHLATSVKMQIDIYTLEGNTKYAMYLFNKEGTKPWNASKPCWSKYLT